MDGRAGQETGGVLPGGSIERSGIDGFLFIGELAKETGTDPKTIRFYERAELLSPPRHGRFRTYLASDVKRLRNVLMLRKMGVPIAQIRHLLELAGADANILGCAKAAEPLKAHLQVLKSRREEIEIQIEQTASALDRLTV
ncbi:MAG: MerR family transcriptional regulator [Rhizobiales bacterium]|nr:MerR family transcriptional regulator [Hyphomicrobiales bacterium]MBI3674925.1 MerR family transcriptional regulator [Hyphomicrobiales bacterium]